MILDCEDNKASSLRTLIVKKIAVTATKALTSSRSMIAAGAAEKRADQPDLQELEKKIDPTIANIGASRAFRKKRKSEVKFSARPSKNIGATAKPMDVIFEDERVSNPVASEGCQLSQRK